MALTPTGLWGILYLAKQGISSWCSPGHWHDGNVLFDITGCVCFFPGGVSLFAMGRAVVPGQRHKEVRRWQSGGSQCLPSWGRKLGCLALILDIAKATPFVALAHSLFGLPCVTVMAVALSAILGSAFSPLLQFRGGKSVAVTFGALLVLPQHELLVTFAAFMFLGFLFMESDGWIVMLGPAGSLIYLATTGASYGELLFVLSVFVILATKHHNELRTIPKCKVKLISWL